MLFQGLSALVKIVSLFFDQQRKKKQGRRSIFRLWLLPEQICLCLGHENCAKTNPFFFFFLAYFFFQDYLRVSCLFDKKAAAAPTTFTVVQLFLTRYSGSLVLATAYYCCYCRNYRHWNLKFENSEHAMQLARLLLLFLLTKVRSHFAINGEMWKKVKEINH